VFSAAPQIQLIKQIQLSLKSENAVTDMIKSFTRKVFLYTSGAEARYIGE